MYGLPEAGLLANELLKKGLIQYGYYECQFTPGLYKVVDAFGIKCQGIVHTRHLKKMLERWYDVSVYWAGKLFCGITLDWN